MAIDRAGRFSTTLLADALRITPDGARPALFAVLESPGTFHSDGDLYLAPWSIGRIRVDRVRPDGSKSVFVDVPIDSRLARKPGRHEGGLLAIASGRKGIYVSDGASVWMIDQHRVVVPVATNINVPNCPTDLPAELPVPHIRSLAVDLNDDIYAAAIGCRAVIRITAAGVVSVVLRSESPWTPSAVALASGDLYVMEFDNPLMEYPDEGRPRIRKRTHDGNVTTLATMEKGQRITRPSK
jgi:hypothetical protein